jgi:hypothetical protein
LRGNQLLLCASAVIIEPFCLDCSASAANDISSNFALASFCSFLFGNIESMIGPNIGASNVIIDIVYLLLKIELMQFGVEPNILGFISTQLYL